MHEVTFLHDAQQFTLVHSDPDDHIFCQIKSSSDFYELELLERLRLLIAPEDLVLDVGANIGNHSVYFAGVCRAQVMAFEPNPSAFSLLKEATARNDLADRMSLFPLALGAQKGRGRIFVPHTHNLGEGQVSPVEQTDEGDVEVCALDALDLPASPRLIKIDVEGMEAQVLDGAQTTIAKARPVLVLESAQPAQLAALLRRLEPLGYAVLEAHNYTPTYILATTSDLETYARTVLSQLVAKQAFSLFTLDQHLNLVRKMLNEGFADLRGKVHIDLSPLTAELRSVLGLAGADPGQSMTDGSSTTEVDPADIRNLLDDRVAARAIQKIEERLTSNERQLSDIQGSARSILEMEHSRLDDLAALSDLLAKLSEQTQQAVETLPDQIEAQVMRELIAVLDRKTATLNVVIGQLQQTLAIQGERQRDTQVRSDQLASNIAEFSVLQDGLWEDDTAPTCSETYRPVEIPYRTTRFAEGWQGWRYEQAVKLESDGSFVINQDNSTPGVQSPPTSIAGPGLHSVFVAFRRPPGPGWILRITAAGTGELLHPDTPLDAAQTHTRFYAPRRVSDIVLKVLSIAPFPGLSAHLVEVRLAKVDDEGTYRAHAALIDAPVIASMASIPSRREMLYDSVHSLLPQCDEVRVFLNGYGDVPEFLDHPRVRARRSEDYDDLGDAGKFGWLDDPDPPGYRIIADDDLIFPPDLVTRLVDKVRETDDAAMVGVHGVLVRQPVTEYYNPENRRAIHFQARCDDTVAVHILATCVMCAHSSRLALPRASFMFRNMGDIWLAKHARQNEIPLLVIDRPFKWVRENTQRAAYETIYGNSLKRTGSRFDSSDIQNAVLKRLEPLSVRALHRPTAVFAAGVGNTDDLEKLLSGFHATRGKDWQFKLVLLAIDPDPDLSTALRTVELHTEVHVIEASDTAGAETRLNTLLTNIPFDLGLYLDARWRFGNSTWVTDGLAAFRNSKTECVLLSEGRARGGCAVGIAGLGVDAQVRDGPLQVALFRPGLALRLCPDPWPDRTRTLKGLFRGRTALRPSFDPMPPEMLSEQMRLARTLLGGLWRDGTGGLVRRKSGSGSSLPVTKRARETGTDVDNRSKDEARRTIAGFFDRTVVLNLDRRPDRWEHISGQLARLGITPLRHRAVDGQWTEVRDAYRMYAISPLRRVSSDLPPLETSNAFYLDAVSEAQRVAATEADRGQKAIATSGAWAYLASMVQILERAIADDVPHLLMLDDDVVFHKDADAIFARALTELPDTWKVLQLGTLQYHWDAEWITWRGRHLYSQKGSSVGSHAVGLHRDILPFMLERARRMEMPYDIGALSEVTRLFPEDNFVIYPNVAIQSLTDSDIASSGFQHGEAPNKIYETYRWISSDYTP